MHHKDVVVGEFFGDLLIGDVLLVELKAVKSLDDTHPQQRTNYLKATGLTLNFGTPRMEIKRVVNGL